MRPRPPRLPRERKYIEVGDAPTRVNHDKTIANQGLAVIRTYPPVGKGVGIP